jgi:hypothetical protein
MAPVSGPASPPHQWSSRGLGAPHPPHGNFAIKSTTADINHYTYKLYAWTGTALGALKGTWMTAAPQNLAHFSNVVAGTYKCTGEVFSSADETASITSGGPQVSTNTATVTAGGAVGYSDFSGTLKVTMGLTGAGILAPDDAGDVAVHHLYTKSLDKSYGPPNVPVVSSFVWIPRFAAFQLIVPANCGGNLHNAVADSARGAGYWVKTTPAAGVADTDWAKEIFGGYYAGQYEASMEDATAISGGGTMSGVLSSRQGVVPLHGVAFDDAILMTSQYDSHCRIMGDEEWTALAVWAQINFQPVYGNDGGTGNGGSPISTDNANVVFTVDPTEPGAALTGTGRLLAGGGGPWPVGTNLTTHTGTTVGVYDLNGNDNEWSRTLGTTAGGNWMLNLFDTGVAAAGVGAVTNLQTSAQFRRYGVPITGGGGPPADWGADSRQSNAVANRVIRGGDYNNPGTSGIWCTNMWPSVGNGHEGGMRPILRY